MQKSIVLEKRIGETPLEVIERFRAEQIEKATNCTSVGKCDDTVGEANYWKSVPMTYAGRLDPMAEGALLILIGDECREKEQYIGLDKEYEVEILFGFETDSYDLLGMPSEVSSSKGVGEDVGDNTRENVLEEIVNKLPHYVGKFTQEYPPYSSRTINGVQMHSLARAGNIPDEVPTKDVEIYSIDFIESRHISSEELFEYIRDNVSKINGDFRQAQIIEGWEKLLRGNKSSRMIKIRVLCSSGTYMRSLAHRIGKDFGIGACAYAIRRTKIFFDNINMV